MWYSIIRDNNRIQITNQGFKEITVKFYQNNEEIKREFLDPYYMMFLDLPQAEGVYKIEIFTEDNRVEYVLPNYPKVLEQLIKDIKEVLCKDNSNCTGCGQKDLKEDSKEYCEKIQRVLSNSILYYSLVGQYYQPYFNIISKEINEGLLKDFSCISLQEMINGSINNLNLTKKLISLYYLTFFYAEQDLSIGTKPNQFKQEHLDKFDFNTIKNCLVGVTDLFLNNMCQEKIGVVDIGNGKKDLPSGVGLYTFTQKDFKELLVPNYYTSKMDEIEHFKVGKVIEGDFSDFKFKNEPLQEGQIITFDDLGKGYLKFYCSNPQLDYDNKSYFTFSVKTKLTDRYTKLSKYEIIINKK